MPGLFFGCNLTMHACVRPLCLTYISAIRLYMLPFFLCNLTGIGQTRKRMLTQVPKLAVPWAQMHATDAVNSVPPSEGATGTPVSDEARKVIQLK